VGVKGVVTEPQALATLPLMSSSRPGVSARLEEVARIERARAPASQYAASDGREAISLAINKKAGANTLQLVDRLRGFIAQENARSSSPAACN
jgi:multidrug efflux pump subunit AcrB